MSEPTDHGAAPPPAPVPDFAALDAREEVFTASLQHASRMVNSAEAIRLHLMLAGFEAMMAEETAITGTPPRPDDPVVRGFLLHQANELRLTRFEVERRVTAARLLRDSMPQTWAVFLGGLASQESVVIAGTVASGLDPRHLDAFDAAAVALVQEERPTAVERKLSDLRDELDPEGTTERQKAASNRRHVRARAEGDGLGVLEIHSTATDIAAAYDRIRTHAVAAHGRDGECRSLGALMVDAAIDAILTGVMRGPEEDGPSFPAERLGHTVDGDRTVIDATILVIVPADTATGASDIPAQVAGMGLVDGETARTIVSHTRSWTRVLVDPVDRAVLGIDTHERYIPAGLKKLLHVLQPTCGCGCGLPAHRADWAPGAGSGATPEAAWRPCDGDDHIERFEHDGRTRHDNLQILCRRSHQAKDAGFADVHLAADGRIGFRNKWGGIEWVTPALSVRRDAPADENSDEGEVVTPF
jgi:hypothetical protein